jgi:hypothetical protein
MVPRARQARWPRPALFALGLAAFSTPGAARAGGPAAARELLKRGYLLAQCGKCDQAVATYEESLRLDVNAITLINAADCEETLGRFGSALGHWVDARARATADGGASLKVSLWKTLPGPTRAAPTSAEMSALEPRFAFRIASSTLDYAALATYALVTAIDRTVVDRKAGLSIGTPTSVQIRRSACDTSIQPGALDVAFDDVVATRK